jgi:guanylate kinase
MCKQVIILSGVAGCGKSTIAQRMLSLHAENAENDYSISVVVSAGLKGE